MLRRAVFLDRDGVINEDVGYVRTPEMLRVIPGSGAALARLRRAGFLTVVVTNQSGIARGMFTEADLRAIHGSLVEQLAAEGGALDAIYYCPHLAAGSVEPFNIDCDCRKPAPGMLLAAARDLDISLADSFMVGDTLTDIEAGRAAGCRTVLMGVSDNHGTGNADAAAADFSAAVDVILEWPES